MPKQNDGKKLGKSLTNNNPDGKVPINISPEELDPMIQEWENFSRHVKGVLTSLKKIKEKSKDFFGSL